MSPYLQVLSCLQERPRLAVGTLMTKRAQPLRGNTIAAVPLTICPRSSSGSIGHAHGLCYVNKTYSVWSNYSNTPFRQQLYTTPCAFLVLHSPVPCLIFTVRMRGTRGGGTAVWIGRRYWRTLRDQSTKHSSCVTNTW